MGSRGQSFSLNDRFGELKTTCVTIFKLWTHCRALKGNPSKCIIKVVPLMIYLGRRSKLSEFFYCFTISTLCIAIILFIVYVLELNNNVDID